MMDGKKPSLIKNLRIKEIEYYAPAKYYIYGMRITLSDGSTSPILGDFYDENPNLSVV